MDDRTLNLVYRLRSASAASTSSHHFDSRGTNLYSMDRFQSPSTASRQPTPSYGRPARLAASPSVASVSRYQTPFNVGPRPGTRVSLAPSRISERASFFGSGPSKRPSTSVSHRSVSSKGKSLKAASSLGTRESDQEVICALSEGRGITPTVGLCFVIVSTGEVLLSQICDNQFYVRTIHKIRLHEPSRILMLTTACPPHPKSTLYSLIEEHLPLASLEPSDRRFYSETSGLEYVQELSFKEDVEAIKVAVEGNFYATCSFAAAMKYLEVECQFRILPHSLRIRYQPSEDTMMIDISAIQSLELIQNLRDAKSSDCLYGLLNQTMTLMGARMLRNNILQPTTLVEEVMAARYAAVEEVASNEEMFLAARAALKGCPDIEKLLTKLIIVPARQSISESEQAINNILMIKRFLESIPALLQALAGSQSPLLCKIRNLCRPQVTRPPLQMILDTIQPEVTYVKTALELRNQRTYAVKTGTNGFLDVARQTYQEGTNDILAHAEHLRDKHNVDIQLKFETRRMYHLRFKVDAFNDQRIPDEFINRVPRKGVIECQTLALKKLNQRICDSATEAIMQSDKVVQELIDGIRAEVPHLFRVCESIALLDMILAFTQLATTKDYVKPVIADAVALKTARHPLLDQKMHNAFVPNDYFATEEHRFQIVTGPNMSGKSTYIRAVALLQVMAQIGSFVPAEYASFPIVHNIFARVTTDDSVESNLSTFAVEMREMAFILRNAEGRSIAIIDELGRGTSSQDGLSIALAMCEALIQSKARVWFATHFTELGDILADRPGVINLYLCTRTTRDEGAVRGMTMLYRVAEGVVGDDHYGIALAKALDLPDDMIAVAEHVAADLSRRSKANRQSSESTRLARRRRLILNLNETLRQVLHAEMDEAALWGYLERLQGEFVDKMAELEGEAEEGGRDIMEVDDDGEAGPSGAQDQEMEDVTS